MATVTSVAAPRIERRPVPAHDLPADLAPVLQRVYAARGLVCAEDLDMGLSGLLDYGALKGIDAATELLQTALQQRWHIQIVGDFDADGATASALSVAALRQMGAAQVEYLIPDRVRDGYGLSAAIVEAAAAAGSPDLIVTVDNGVASLAGVAAARERGIRVLVTDHHLPGESLPAADAMVNPNQPGCGFASRALAGVGVVFYVLLALRARLSEAGWFEDRPAPVLAEYLDLVAIGTVADLVPLDRNNRILVAQGLRRIRAGRARAGVYALLAAAGRDPTRATATDIAFGVAPRLNAAGRLDDMRLGVACLLADAAEADTAAQKLEQLNSQRRVIQDRMQAAAGEALKAAETALPGNLPTALSVYAPDWHEGIVGLVAGHLCQNHNRPAVAFAPAAEPGMLKGSARSIPGVHIRDVLANIAADDPDLIERFGGHAGAAGLSLAAERLPAFRAAFVAAVDRVVTPAMLAATMVTDGPLSAEELCLESARALRQAGPWGAGFPEPSFDGMFEVIAQRIVGECHLKLRLREPGSTASLEAIAFGRGVPVSTRAPVRIVYRPEANIYRGAESLQLVVMHMDHAAAVSGCDSD